MFLHSVVLMLIMILNIINNDEYKDGFQVIFLLSFFFFSFFFLPPIHFHLLTLFSQSLIPEDLREKFSLYGQEHVFQVNLILVDIYIQFSLSILPILN